LDAIWMKEDNVLVLVDKLEIEHRIPLPRLQYTLKHVIMPKYEVGNWRIVDLFISTKYSDLYRGAPCTYAMLYRIFRDLDKLFTVRRFKGLGEMSAEAIKKTCIDPQERSFVTIRSVGDVDKVYEMLGVDTSARKKLVNRGFLEE
jgi:DNA gyrase/topoisomerase IV subunit B